MEHAAASELLGAYALDACEEGEATAVEAHISVCPPCRSEAELLKNLAGWLGVSEATLPSARLRSRLLQEAETTPRDDTSPD